MTSTSVVRTVCDPNCHANPRCGILAHVEDGRIVRIEAADFPRPEFSKRICLMGLSRLEYQYHRDRLLHPLRRVGERGAGRWERITWDEALDFIAENFRGIAAAHGSRAIAAISGSGANGVLTRGASYRFAAALGGTAARPGGVDYGVPKGLEYTFGVRASTYFGPGGHEFADAVNSRTIVFWGGNDAETRFVDYPFVREAQRRGAKVICIDPNRTATASKADLWISLRPGTDGALALSLLHQVVARGMHDEAFLRAHTNGPFLVREDTGAFLRERDVAGGDSMAYVVWDAASAGPRPSGSAREVSLGERYPVRLANGATVHCAPAFQLLRELVAAYPPERAAEITAVPAEAIRDLAADLATRKPSAIRIGYGVDRWYWSDYTARAVAALTVATGNVGIPGGGISMHSGTYAMPAGMAAFRNPGGRSASLLDAIGLMGAIESGRPYPVKALWLSGSNLFNQTAANRGRVLSSVVPRLEFIVVSEHFMTASAELADVVLPAATIFERLDLIPGIFLQLQQPAVAPEGESRSELDMFAALAQRMGYGQYFARAPEEYLEEALAGQDPLLEGITLERLRREGPVFLNRPPEPYVAFRDRLFPTPSGRIELYKEELVRHGAELPVYREPIEASPFNPIARRYPLTLLFSHSRHRIHSTFANMPMLKRLEPEPVLEIHPVDAAPRGVADDELVRVFNDRGTVTLRCRLNGDLRPGVLVLPEGHWVKDFRAGDPYGLTHDLVSPTSENYAFYDTLVEVERAAG
ncbi:MAG TPA: molybdopterin-dependent oxidoreductase [Candidatus Sulfotelmatobacter sp.]|nr:molybdopterin-dependent oxidoreductase [Candidatus Sulfotelmatobacter sp.]